MSLDRERPFTIVGGNPPASFVQDGQAYSQDGKHLGACDPDGTLTGAVTQPEATEPEGETFEGDRSELEFAAFQLGVDYHPNIGTEKLRARVEEALAEKRSVADDAA